MYEAVRVCTAVSVRSTRSEILFILSLKYNLLTNAGSEKKGNQQKMTRIQLHVSMFFFAIRTMTHIADVMTLIFKVKRFKIRSVAASPNLLAIKICVSAHVFNLALEVM